MRALALLRASATASALLLGATAVRAALHHPTPAPALAPAPAPALALAPALAPAPADADRELQIAVARAALLPPDVDAPGTDSAIAGRPAGGTRLIDTAVDANGSRLRIYATTARQDELEPALARAIAGHGFARAPSVDPATVTFARGHDFVVLRFARRDERTVVSIVEFGFRSAGDPR